jgi:hypothetical protein
MTAQTLTVNRFIKICRIRGFPTLAKSSLKWLPEAHYTGHLRLTETWQSSCDNSSVRHHRYYEAAMVNAVELVSVCTEAGKKFIFNYLMK